MAIISAADMPQSLGDCARAVAGPVTSEIESSSARSSRSMPRQMEKCICTVKKMAGIFEGS